MLGNQQGRPQGLCSPSYHKSSSGVLPLATFIHLLYLNDLCKCWHFWLQAQINFYHFSSSDLVLAKQDALFAILGEL